MDTFMDKLAQKFTAQEMIKANGAAETEEMNRLKAQVQEYTDCLNRMQQICTEIEQTAAAAKGKVETAQLNTDDLRAQLLEIRQNMQDFASQEPETSTEDMIKEQLARVRNAQAEQIDNMWSAQSEQLESIKNAQAAGFERIEGTQAMQMEGFRNLQAEQLENIKGLQQDQLDGLKGIQDTQFESMKVSIEDQLDSMRSMVKAQVSGIKSAQETQMDSLRNALETQNSTLETQLGEMKTNLETQLSGSNEFVHRECVKVYRNVQAVVGEENTKQIDNLDYTLKPMSLRVQNVYKVSVAALIFSIAGVVLQVLSILHII